MQTAGDSEDAGEGRRAGDSSGAGITYSSPGVIMMVARAIGDSKGAEGKDATGDSRGASNVRRCG